MLSYRRYVRIEPASRREHLLLARFEHERVEISLAQARIVGLHVHVFACGIAVEPERLSMVSIAVVECAPAVVEGIALHAEHVFMMFGKLYGMVFSG